RGGGNGGWQLHCGQKAFNQPRAASKGVGKRTKLFSVRKRSSFGRTFAAACFFSSFLAVETRLQSPQGCLPSNVFSNASRTGALWEKLHAMPTQATDCRKAQCTPKEMLMRATRVSFAIRPNTAF